MCEFPDFTLHNRFHGLKTGDAPLGRTAPATQASPQRRCRNRHGEHPQIRRRAHQTDQDFPAQGAGGGEASPPEEDAERHTACSAERRPLEGHAEAIRQIQDRLQHVQALFPERGLEQDPWGPGQPEGRDGRLDARLELRGRPPHLGELGGGSQERNAPSERARAGGPPRYKRTRMRWGGPSPFT